MFDCAESLASCLHHLPLHATADSERLHGSISNVPRHRWTITTSCLCSPSQGDSSCWYQSFSCLTAGGGSAESSLCPLIVDSEHSGLQIHSSFENKRVDTIIIRFALCCYHIDSYSWRDSCYLHSSPAPSQPGSFWYHESWTVWCTAISWVNSLIVDMPWFSSTFYYWFFSDCCLFGVFILCWLHGWFHLS